MKKILCPIGLSDDLKTDVLKKTAEFAKTFNSSVLLMYVSPDFQRDAEYYRISMTLGEISKDLLNMAQKEIDRLASDPILQGVKVETVVAQGNAAEKIIETSEEKNVDMIVMGSHGRSGVSRLFMGSVAEKVVRMSSVPVLIVRPTE